MRGFSPTKYDACMKKSYYFMPSMMQAYSKESGQIGKYVLIIGILGAFEIGLQKLLITLPLSYFNFTVKWYSPIHTRSHACTN